MNGTRSQEQWLGGFLQQTLPFAAIFQKIKIQEASTSC
jgi:hypothetical protein